MAFIVRHYDGELGSKEKFIGPFETEIDAMKYIVKEVFWDGSRDFKNDEELKEWSEHTCAIGSSLNDEFIICIAQ